MIESKGSDSGVSYWNFADPSSRLTFEERSSALGILTGHEAAATETFHAGDRQRLAGTWPRLRLRCRHVPRCEADALPSALGLGRLGEGLQKGQSHRLVMGIKYDLSAAVGSALRAPALPARRGPAPRGRARFLGTDRFSRCEERGPKARPATRATSIRQSISRVSRPHRTPPSGGLSGAV